MIYSKYSDLYGKGHLKADDQVIFNFNGMGYDHRVDRHGYLNNLVGGGNDRILIDMGYSKTQMNEFASHQYGFKPVYGIGDSSWPEARKDGQDNGEMGLLTSMVLEIFHKIEDGMRPPKKSKPEPRPIATNSPRYGYGDLVYFTDPFTQDTTEYEVYNNYLNSSSGRNAFIFDEMFGLTKSQKQDWASMAYGHKALEGDWPVNPEGDRDVRLQGLNIFIEQIKVVIDYIGRNELDIDDEDYDIVAIIRKVLKIDLNGPTKDIPKSGALNNSSNNNFKQQTDGKTIQIERVTPTITTGEKRTGRRIRGKTGRTAITVGHLGHHPVTG